MLRSQTTVLFILNGTTALAFAFILPVMSLFLVTELNTEPALIGIYTSLTAVMTIIVSQKLTGLIDKGVSSKFLLLFGLLGIMASAMAFTYATKFWHALVIGCVLMPIASSSIPLILTVIRRYADSTGKNSAKLNSQMRSSVSFLWIFGPPLAFLSVDQFGFANNFYLSAAIAACVVVWIVLLLDAPKATQHNSNERRSTKLPASVWFLGLVILLANISNSTYINAMPIYLTQELQLTKSYPGYLMGITAAVEIPVMLLAVNWAHRFGKILIMKLGFATGAVFYVGMYFSTSIYSLFALQILNGLFFGIFVGLGITVMQDLAPKAIGKASAFYTNSMLVGTMLGTTMMGIISQYFGFKTAFLLSLASILLSLIGLTLFDSYREKLQQMPQDSQLDTVSNTHKDEREQLL